MANFLYHIITQNLRFKQAKIPCSPLIKGLGMSVHAGDYGFVVICCFDNICCLSL